MGRKFHFVTQRGQLISRLHAPISAKMRARRIFDFGEKCAFVAAPNLDQAAAWPPEGILAWCRKASHQQNQRAGRTRTTQPGQQPTCEADQIRFLAKTQDMVRKRVAQEKGSLAVSQAHGSFPHHPEPAERHDGRAERNL